MGPQEKEWNLKREDGAAAASEEKKLELRLGPPGEENWSSSSIGGGVTKKNRDKENEHSLLSLGYFSSSMSNNGKQQTHKFPSAEDHNNSARPVVGSSVLSGPWTKTKHHQQQTTKSPFLQSLPPVTAMESSQPWCTKAVDLQKQQQLQQKSAEKKAFSSPANTAVSPCSSQKRTAPGPVVGWPPIRSFRKNLSSSSKQALDQSQNVVSHNEKTGAELSNGKGLFVKINMDGVPIGRKVDLKAYDSYEKLSTAVDDLFRGLLAAQRDSSAGGILNKQEEEIKAITGVLDGSGDYTLVYEDNEGDRMLVGDVPWHMFVSTVKRLRVLKSSELSALTLRSK